MRDPQYPGPGFFDPQDAESILRAILADHGERLANAALVAQGKDAATAQVERDLHVQILGRHRNVRPFADVAELHTFIRAYRPETEAQDTMKQLLCRRLGVD